MANIEEYLFELRYKPNPRILDKRGEIARALTNEKLNFWSVNTNTVVLNPEGDENMEAIMSYQNISFRVNSPYDKKFFREQLALFLKSAWSYLPTNEILRIGIRPKYLIEKESFSDIYEKYRHKFLGLSDEDVSEFGGSLIDVGFPLNFYEGPNYYDLVTGPLKKEQYKMFFKNFDETLEQGLFLDLDYYNKDVSPNIRQKEVMDFVDKGIEKGDKLIKLFNTQWLT